MAQSAFCSTPCAKLLDGHKEPIAFVSFSHGADATPLGRGQCHGLCVRGIAPHHPWTHARVMSLLQSNARNAMTEAEKRERRALERKLSEMEEELKVSTY